MYVTQQIMLHRSFQTGHDIDKEFSLAKKDEKKDFKEMKLKKEQGWRISKKRKKVKSLCNKKGMKCDLKYI